MAHRLIISAAALLLAAAFSAFPTMAAEDDYFVGLSAYRDGLHDVAESFFTDYLSGDTTPENARYAHYLLYRLNMERGEHDAAWEHYSAIADATDKRFDRERMALDGMVLAVKRDCNDARLRAETTRNPSVIAIFVESECTVSPEVVDTVIELDAPTPVMLGAARKITEYPELMRRLFVNLDLDQLEPSHFRFFGGYFSKHEMWDEFWDVYAKHKDDDLVALALDRLWKIGDREKYLVSYDFNRPKFTLPPAAHCRAIEAHNELKTAYDCDILDGCFTDRTGKFVKAKHACLLQQDAKNAVSALVSSVTGEAANGLCAGAPYMASKNLADAESYAKLSGCDNRKAIAEQLFAAKNADGLMALAGSSDADQGRYERGLGYVLRGNMEKATGEAEAITDAALKKALLGRISQ